MRILSSLKQIALASAFTVAPIFATADLGGTGPGGGDPRPAEFIVDYSRAIETYVINNLDKIIIDAENSLYVFPGLRRPLKAKVRTL